MIYIPDSEKIYFKKIRSYFSEVVISYANGSYRSAIVMLYSVIVCDLLFKLNELSDVYGDEKAKELLDEIERIRLSDEHSKSQWEKDLIEKVYKQTNLLGLDVYKNIEHLKDHRNLSAHPALNDNYELFEPTKEITICHIKNMLEGVLIKPPIFINNILNMMLDDIAEKKDIYESDKIKFHEYLSRKYFSRMTDNMKKKVFRSLWKLCFNLPNDEKCMANIKLNGWVMEFLYPEIKDICEFIEQDPMFTQLDKDPRCCLCLCLFLAKFPIVYSILCEDIRIRINSFVEIDTTAKQISWFIECNYRKHIQNLISNNFYNDIDYFVFNFIKKNYENAGELPIFIDYCIEYFGRSYNYTKANERYCMVIQSLLSKMTRNQYINLIQKINNNAQIYDRYTAYETNTEIFSHAISVLGKDFDFSMYPHFKFDSTIEKPSKEDITSNNINNILSL